MNIVAQLCDGVNEKIGAAAKWLTLIMVLVQFLVVVLRYVFGIGSIQMQEAVMYMHAILFLSAAAASWQQNAHVRVDIFFSKMPADRQALVNLLGTVFFVLPLCFLILFVSLDYVSISWSVHEGSRETSGIHAIYLLKSMILVFAVQLILQAISIILNRGQMEVSNGAS